MITNSTVISWFNLLSTKRWHTYMFPRSYMSVSDTFAVIGLIAETALKFISKTRYKALFDKQKHFFYLQQFKTCFNAWCSLTVACKDIVPNSERTKSKSLFSTVTNIFLNKMDIILKVFKNICQQSFQEGNHSCKIFLSEKIILS